MNRICTELLQNRELGQVNQQNSDLNFDGMPTLSKTDTAEDLCSWPFLQEQVKEGKLIPLDLFFARRLLAHITVDPAEEEKIAVCLAVMMWKYREGHLCVNFHVKGDRLMEAAALGSALLPKILCEEVHGESLCISKPICRFGNDYYFQKNWVFETQCCIHLMRLLKSPPHLSLTYPEFRGELNIEQEQAVSQGLKSSVSLIVGGPGTGKTFTAKQFLKVCLESLLPEQKKKFRIAVTAPTGKAVAHLFKQISSVVKNELDADRVLIGTLHALLQCREEEDRLNQTLLLVDLILVDECSMIDAKMWAQLLLAVPSGARLVLIGDHQQLPSVGQGNVFADLIQAAPFIPVTHLTQCKRIENATLIQLAEALSRNEVVHAQALLKPLCCSLATQSLFDVLVDRLKEKLFWVIEDTTILDYEYYLLALDQFRVLSCLRQGEWGVDRLNDRLWTSFRSQLPRSGWWVIPILITQNHRHVDLYNGDTGLLIRKIGSEMDQYKVGIADYALFPDKSPIAGLMLPAFEYAYCLSVHKSQGSEYKEVTLLVPPGSEKFDKSIIYTALTRAKHALTIYGDEERIGLMLNQQLIKRSGLTARLSCTELI